MRLGVHCSIRNGFGCAVEEAVNAGCETIQIFTRSPRVWKARVIAEEEAEVFTDLLKSKDIHPLVVHTPYLPNLCTANKELFEKSIKLLEEDIQRCLMLKAKYLVIHPGAYSEGKSIADGTAKIIEALDRISGCVKGELLILLETMAGGGRRLGGSFEWFALMLSKLKTPGKISFCLDTCHLYGAGFDLSGMQGLKELSTNIDSTITWDKVKLIHLNDSKAPLGSKKDMHQHIGKGFIGIEGFRNIVNHPKIKNIPGILETPKDSPEADKKNLTTLRNLMR